MKITLRQAWLLAMFSVAVLWSFINIAATYSTQVLQVNYLIFTCSAFASSAMVLLLWSGPGPLARETFRAVDTWAFGLILLLDYLFLLGIFSFVTSTDGSILKRMSLLCGILAGWLFFVRRGGRLQFMGMLLIVTALYLVAREVAVDALGPLLTLVILSGCAEAARVLVAETHRTNRQAAQHEDPRARARVVGLVMFVLATLFLSGTALLAVTQSLSVDQLLPIVPQLSDFMHTPSIVAGMVVGVLLMTPVRLIEFSVAQIIRAENFLALAAFSTLATLFWESLVRPLLGLPEVQLSAVNWLAVVAVTLGGICVAVDVWRQRRQAPPVWRRLLREVPQQPQLAATTRDLLAEALEYCQGDVEAMTRSLGLPGPLVQEILNDQQLILALTEEAQSEAEKHFRHYVADIDPLTGLLQRRGFKQKITNIQKTTNTALLFYFDLNRFKQVNDQYGHAIGDRALVAMAGHLKRVLPDSAIIGRLGGDEFVACLPGTWPAHIQQQLLKRLGRAFVLNGRPGLRIRLATSIGCIAWSPGVELFDSALARADAAMYAHKQQRDV